MNVAMFSYFVVFAAVLAISTSLPQEDFGFPDEEQFDGDSFQQNFPTRQNLQGPSRPIPTFDSFPPITSGPSSTTVDVPSQSTTQASITTRSPLFRQCLANSCPTTSEYNPVCGSDNVNYDNQQKLNCANFCGPRVDPNWQPVAQLRRGTCSAL